MKQTPGKSNARAALGLRGELRVGAARQAGAPVQAGAPLEGGHAEGGLVLAPQAHLLGHAVRQVAHLHGACTLSGHPIIFMTGN